MIIKASGVRKLFNERNVQISDDAVKTINEIMERDLRKMVARCVEGNVKRLTPDIIYIALGNLFNTHKEYTMQNREEFLKERKAGLGGSDVHHLFYSEPYGCARKLWYDKTDQAPDYPVVQTSIMTRGHKLEQLIRDEYSAATGRKIRRVNRMLVNKEHPWAMCHLDAEIVSFDDRGTGVLECKTVGRPMYYKIQEEGIPHYWIWQIQHYLMTTGRQWGSYAILWADNWEFIHFDVDADPVFRQQIIEAGQKFWRMVKNGPAPERLDIKDKRCGLCEFRNTCQGTKLMALAQNGTEQADFDPSFDTLLNEYYTLKSLQDEASELVDAKKKEITELLGERVLVDCNGFRLYYKPVESTRFKSTALKNDDPELYEKYAYKSVSRPFRIRPI